MWLKLKKATSQLLILTVTLPNSNIGIIPVTVCTVGRATAGAAKISYAGISL